MKGAPRWSASRAETFRSSANPLVRTLDEITAAVEPQLGELLREIDRRSPHVVTSALQHLGGLTLIRARGRLIQTLPYQEHSDRLSVLVDSFIESVDRENDLVRLSLTAPLGGDRELAPLARKFAATIAERRSRDGAWLVIDRRADGSEHLHGIASCPKVIRSSLLADWCASTGASRSLHRGGRTMRTVTGWHLFAETRDRSLLDENLRRVVQYALKRRDPTIPQSTARWRYPAP